MPEILCCCALSGVADLRSAKGSIRRKGLVQKNSRSEVFDRDCLDGKYSCGGIQLSGCRQGRSGKPFTVTVADELSPHNDW